MIKLFNQEWNEVPTVFVDVETTGTIPGIDATVQVAVVRFEGGEPVARESSFIEPGREIPLTAITIHGITNEMVKGAPTLPEFFSRPAVSALLEGAQPGAYNAQFDRAFLPLHLFPDWSWPWLDPLTLVRVVDRFVRGQGRHKLAAACQRREIKIVGAHDAAVDAEAAGRLFYTIVPELDIESPTMGELLAFQREREAGEWFRFNEWMAKQPQLPKEVFS